MLGFVLLIRRTDRRMDMTKAFGLKMGGRKSMLIKITNWRPFEVRS